MPKLEENMTLPFQSMKSRLNWAMNLQFGLAKRCRMLVLQNSWFKVKGSANTSCLKVKGNANTSSLCHQCFLMHFVHTVLPVIMVDVENKFLALWKSCCSLNSLKITHCKSWTNKILKSFYIRSKSNNFQVNLYGFVVQYYKQWIHFLTHMACKLYLAKSETGQPSKTA